MSNYNCRSPSDVVLKSSNISKTKAVTTVEVFVSEEDGILVGGWSRDGESCHVFLSLFHVTKRLVVACSVLPLQNTACVSG